MAVTGFRDEDPVGNANCRTIDILFDLFLYSIRLVNKKNVSHVSVLNHFFQI